MDSSGHAKGSKNAPEHAGSRRLLSRLRVGSIYVRKFHATRSAYEIRRQPCLSAKMGQPFCVRLTTGTTTEDYTRKLSLNKFQFIGSAQKRGVPTRLLQWRACRISIRARRANDAERILVVPRPFRHAGHGSTDGWRLLKSGARVTAAVNLFRAPLQPDLSMFSFARSFVPFSHATRPARSLNHVCVFSKRRHKLRAQTSQQPIWSFRCVAAIRLAWVVFRMSSSSKEISNPAVTNRPSNSRAACMQR